MESSYQAALRRRQKLLEELEKVEQYILLSHELFGEPAPNWIQIPPAERIASDAARPVPSSEESAPREAVDGHKNRSATRFRPEGYARPADVVRAARRILIARGRPMTRSQILAAMEEEGMIIPGVDKSKTLGTTLWRAQKEFIQLEGQGYWVRGMPNFLVGYDPRSEGVIDGGDF